LTVDPAATAPSELAPIRGAALRGLYALAETLTGLGLATRVEEHLWSLVAKNEDATPDEPLSPLAIAYGPVRLVQRIRISIDPDGALAFYWEWNGPSRDAPTEVEYLGPAVAIDDAAKKIAYVLALVDE
jgi:hypothetical protein